MLREGSFGIPGTNKHQVTSGTAASIKAGQFCLKTPGSAYVVAWDASNAAKPVIGTDYMAGLALSDSTETASAAGYVDILPIVPGLVYLGTPTTPATFGTATTGVVTQSTYDALVGDRVLLRTTAAGLQTVEPTDGATYGLVIMPLDLTRYPGKVAFSLNPNVSYLTKNS